jgi:hypothetical protein
VENGYQVVFGGSHIEGRLHLRQDTGNLSTLHVKIKKGFDRRESIEDVLLKDIRKRAETMPAGVEFDYTRFQPVLAAPREGAKIIAWYHPSAGIRLYRASARKGWLKLKLPSKAVGYLKGVKPHRTKG